VPPNYREQQGHPLQSHEKKGALVLAAAVVVIGAGVGIWAVALGGNGHAKGRCVTVNVAGATGGGQLQQCGQAARSWCTTEASATGYVPSLVQAACRKEGFLAKDASAGPAG
jgi:hypothetical protein